jgi:membrane fusion protein (multidrug efflux system)
MSKQREAIRGVARALVCVAAALAFAAGVVVLMLYLAGVFRAKVSAQRAEAASEAAYTGPTAEAQLRSLRREESAVGSIQPVHETNIGSKLLARVMQVNMKAGQKVQAGDVLVRLDDTDLKARLQQAKAALNSATAAKEQAAADQKRGAKLVQTNVMSRQEYEKTETSLRAAEADATRAQEAINEVQATLDWATIRAPMEGTIVDKKVDAGDTVTPGQLLATLFDPKRMQLVASVRESLAHRLRVGHSLPVQVEGLSKRCEGTVSEIVPQAQVASRTFQVKVTGPCPPGVYAGTFGRIYIPLDDEDVLVIPPAAVRRVGQLELVDVVGQQRLERRAVRIGRTLAIGVEVLSGLRPGERVAIAPSADAQGLGE